MSHTHNGLKCLDFCGMYHLEIGWFGQDIYRNEVYKKFYTAVSSSIDELKSMLMDVLHKELGILANGYQLTDDNVYETRNKYEGYRYEVAECDLVRRVEYELDCNPNDIRVTDAYFFAQIKQMKYVEFSSWCKGYWN